MLVLNQGIVLVTIIKEIEKAGIRVDKDVDLSKRTWIKTGGVCAYWIMPATTEQLSKACKCLFANSIKFDIVGQTSNMYFHSTYNPQVVVSTIEVNSFEIKDDTLICGCGVSVMKLARECLALGYAGFYGLVGLPGTVASAVVNNAGCFQCSISSMLISADILNIDGTIETIYKKDFHFSKRSSAFKRGDRKGVILSVKMQLQRSGNVEEEKKKAENTKVYRKNHQEGYKSNLGSVFAVRKQRHNVRNIIALLTAKIFNLFKISSFSYARKNILLWLYRCSELKRYISDKNINTFVWRDEYAENAFEKYKQFMSKVYKNLEIEIEEKK